MIQNSYHARITEIADQLCATTQSKQQAHIWALWLLKKATNRPITHLVTETDPLSRDQIKQVLIWVDQITRQHKPIEYILGEIPFIELLLQVQPPTLIPRIETEYWLSHLIDRFQRHGQKPKKILEIGTGSGCIALSLAQAFSADVLATDISAQALALAQKNAKYNAITTATFAYSDLFGSIDPRLSFDLIISNPPYVPLVMKSTLSRRVLNWEDHHALFSGPTGIDHISKIIAQSTAFLRCPCVYKTTPIAQLCLEIDVSQANAAQKLLQNHGFDTIQVITDQFSRQRAIFAIKGCTH